MNKLVIAGAGLALAVGATIAMSPSAGAATAHPAKTVYSAIPGTPTGAPANGHCGYPVNNAVLTLGPTQQVVASGGRYHFSGTYGCNGHGLALHKIFVSASFRIKSGGCTNTTASGAYSCAFVAKGSGTAQSYTQHAVSNPVTASTH